MILLSGCLNQHRDNTTATSIYHDNLWVNTTQHLRRWQLLQHQ